MIATCPSCAARYVVDPARLGPGGRRLKCVRCASVWRQPAPAAPAADAAPANGPPPPEAAPSGGASNLPAVRRPDPWRARFAWLLLVLIAVVLAGGALALRESVVAALPQARTLYELAGVVAPKRKSPFAYRGVSHVIASIGGDEVVNVRGLVANVSGAPAELPDLEIFLVDAAGRTVGRWRFPPPRRRLAGGETVPFSTWTAKPPGVARVDAGFAAADGAGRSGRS